MKNANFYIADELAIKTRYLHQALDQANEIISTLDSENSRLKDVLANLASKNNEDLQHVFEVHNDRLCTI